MPSFVENINKLAEKLEVIVESNEIFDDNTIPILEEIAELDLKEAIWDLRKGNYLGNRKIDINLALNRQGITEDLIEEYPDQAEDIWTDLSGVVLYDRCTVTFTDGEVITINFEFDGNPTTISTHGDLLVQLSSSTTFLAKLEDTLISGFAWDVVGEIVRIYDVIGQNSNIERVQLHAVSGDYAEQTPIYYWAKTTSAFQTLSMRAGDIIKLGNDIDSIILLANRINEILELHARMPELIDTYTGDVPHGDLTVYNSLDELMAIYAELETLVIVYNDIKPVGTNYIQSVANDLQGANNIGTVANDLNLGIDSNINLVGSNIDDVITVSDNIGNINTVSADISSVNIVSTDIANINNVATNVVPNITDILLGNTIKGVILSTYSSFSDAISNANTLGKSLVIDQPVDLGGATVDCLGVSLVWFTSNILSNGTLSNVNIIAKGYQIFDSITFTNMENCSVRTDPRWFGASYDNTDDSFPCQQAIDLAAMFGGVVEIDAKNMRWNTGVVLPGKTELRFNNYCFIHIDKDVPVGLTVRDSSGTANYSSITGRYTLARTSVKWHESVDTDTSSIGLLLENCRYGKFNVDAQGFDSGVILLGKGGGTVHNVVKIGHINNCRKGLQFIDETDGVIGYSNSNYVYGGRIGYSSSVVATANANGISMRNITITNNAFQNNNNTVIGVSLESPVTVGADAYSSSSALIRCNGGRNQFINLRYETTSARPMEYYVRFGTGSTDNIVSGGRIPNDFFERILDESTTPTDFNRYEAFGIRSTLLSKTQVQTITNTYSSIIWDTASNNENSLWASGSPTYITIPTHVRKIRITCHATLNQVVDTTMLLRNVDTGTVEDKAFFVRNTGMTLFATTSSINVTPGHRYQIELTSTPDAIVDVNGIRTWAEIEILN